MLEAMTPNPLSVGTESRVRPDPCLLVLVAGTDDLAQRRILPAIYGAMLDGELPVPFALVAFSPTDHTDAGFRAFAREGIERFSRRPLEESAWETCASVLHHVRGSYSEQDDLGRLRLRLEEIERTFGLPRNRLFHLAVPSARLAAVVDRLRESESLRPGTGPGPWTRVVVENPMGRDPARVLDTNAILARSFDERQIYRIDHHLSKESAQNLMVLRFANSIFEPLWNCKYVDHVQISVAEDEGAAAEGAIDESFGTLRDIVQHHLLRLVCLVAMEPTATLDADSIRDHELEVLRNLRPMARSEIAQSVVRAQYAAGFHRGSGAVGYLSEPGIRSDSATETFVALKLFVDNWRWTGVPFYLRTGKRMTRRASEIAIAFKHVPRALFNADPQNPLSQNVLSLRIRPDEGLTLQFSSKLPGPGSRVCPVRMDFRHGSAARSAGAQPYERLMIDVMAGDSTLFMRRDAVEASWAWIAPILEAWQSSGVRRLPEYAAGTWGPVEATRLIQNDGREWRTL
jgi:glucose-6-phosphate 1-dehydrogenase